MKNLPYVVSSDIQRLLKEWTIRLNLTLPDDKFFKHLRFEFSKEMRRTFPSFELIPENDLATGLECLIKESGLPTISLDRVYHLSPHTLEITRMVDENGLDRGLSNRNGTPSIKSQLSKIQSRELLVVNLVDDVVFDGAMIEEVIKWLAEVNTQVKYVLAGIGIRRGVAKIQKIGIETRCVRLYNEVIDEICERDFYPGVPLSGRQLVGSKNVGIPYILPFGKPGNWASIPAENQKSLSMFCIQQTIGLFEEIECLSQRQVTCADLDRKVFGLPTDNTRFVEALHSCTL